MKIERSTCALIFIVLAALTSSADYIGAYDLGLFHTLPVEPPDRGVIRMTNTSFYSGVTVNPVLQNRYGVRDTRIFSSVTGFELGVTNSLTFTGNLPYYADLFTQNSKGGKKSGAGDVVLGLRYTALLPGTSFRALTFGGRFRIPEQLGYGPEPLGFRTFSYGEFAYSMDIASGFHIGMTDWNASLSLISYPNAAKIDSVFSSDTFYNTGMGYLGIGSHDALGFSQGIFQNQMQVSIGASVPLRPWITGIMEFNMVSFVEQPRRDKIMSLTPAVRFGSPEGFQMSVGMDFSMNGQITDRTALVRLRIPTLSVRDIKRLLERKGPGAEIRSRNALVAVKEFKKADYRYMYERDLRNALEGDIRARDALKIIPNKATDEAFLQKALVPLEESPSSLGIRLGSNYLITTEILSYDVRRSASLHVPFLIKFPQTTFKLHAHVTVEDLTSGKEHQLGIVDATVVQPRGVQFFPVGYSSDIVYLSEPDRCAAQRELINNWVNSFNNLMMEKIEVFGWEPRKTEVKGSEETSG